MASLDEVFDLFSRERRRYALYYLDQEDGPVTIDELSKKISEWENDAAREHIPDDTFKDVTLSLEHNHLPKVNDADAIEFDRENGQIQITGTSPEFSLILSIAKGLEQPSTDIDVVNFDDFD